MSKKIVSILGNIGVGKTTLVECLKQRFHDAIFIKEPVDQWINIKNDKTGKNILGIFYDDKNRWSYTFENIAFITRLSLLIDALEQPHDLIIMDGSLATDKNIFAQMLHDDGYIDSMEWSAYNLWNQFYEKHIKNHHKIQYIYLKCDPKIAQYRTEKRKRPEEKSIELSYLEKVDHYIDNLFHDNNDLDIITLDANCEENSPQYKENLEKIINALK